MVGTNALMAQIASQNLIQMHWYGMCVVWSLNAAVLLYYECRQLLRFLVRQGTCRWSVLVCVCVCV